jgi:hypothetical protein
MNHIKINPVRIAFCLLMAAVCSLSVSAQSSISLAGSWQFAQGDQPHYQDKVALPGSMLTNGKGNPVSIHTHWISSLYDSSYFYNPYMAKYRVEGQMKFPFFLTPARHYVGNAWYQRTVDIPKTWQGQRILLFLERPHIETTIFVNGVELGHQMSLSVPHQYDITRTVKFGASNTIAIRIYNGIENVCVGQDSHSVTDQTQGDWNGIAGQIKLLAQPADLHIRRVQIYPEVEQRRARIVLCLGGTRLSARKWQEQVHIQARLNDKIYSATQASAADSTMTCYVNFGDEMLTWDEFHPHLYQLSVTAGRDHYTTTFGMRNMTIRGMQFYLNGHPIWLRGTVENCTFPDTGYPPTDTLSWLTIFRKCKSYGINHIRFHSYSPPDAAFAAADKLGLYLQPEGPSWPNHGVKLRRGMAIDKYLLSECKSMVDAYGHHPSFVMMAAGNEPAGDWVNWCADFVKQMHAYDSTRVYTGASVGGGWAWDFGSEYHVKGGARGLDWDNRAPQSVDEYTEGIIHPRNFKGERNTQPMISHEQGQWCAFPDLEEVEQYKGVYQAKNFDIFSDLLRDNGMSSRARDFLMASGHLQVLAYKYEVERNLRTPDYAGFQLLGLNDYSGQGTALVGPLNVFWREKGYVDSTAWSSFCSSVVPLAEFSRFIYTTADTLRVPIDVYNASGNPLQQAIVSCGIYSAQPSGELHELPLVKMNLAEGKSLHVYTVNYPLSSIPQPGKYTLKVNVNRHQNTYDFWVYPAKTDMPIAKDIYISDTLDAKAIKTLNKGGKVLLLAAGKVMLGSDVKQTYLPVFWNTSWFKMRPPHTTGATIDVRHPLFRYFPTDNWSNLNWWELLNKQQVMNLREFPADYQSPIQPIDTWHVSRKLGMLVEAQVLKGKLLITTMDLQQDLDHRIVARQMRAAILRYMESDSFQPSLTLSPSVISHFFTEQAPAVNMFTKDSPDELKPKIK